MTTLGASPEEENVPACQAFCSYAQCELYRTHMRLKHSTFRHLKVINLLARYLELLGGKMVCEFGDRGIEPRANQWVAMCVIKCGENKLCRM
jgi:hypothetical protein